MQCPGCRSDMQTLTVAALLGRTADVHACAQCRAFWFEPFEDLHLTRSSTLSLLHLITERSAGGPFPRQSFCPVCHSELGLTHDMQHSTRFQYWSCAAGHGRFMSFIDFMREKDFIRPLTPQQVAELRKIVDVIHCSNCGAPVNLATESVCSHCGSPLSMIDTGRLADVTGVVPPAASGPPSDAVAALLRQSSAAPRPTLIDLGLELLGRLLRT